MKRELFFVPVVWEYLIPGFKTDASLWWDFSLLSLSLFIEAAQSVLILI